MVNVRDATSSLNGYSYQILITIDNLLKTYNNNTFAYESIKCEGIEDIDIILNNKEKDIHLIQVKYHDCETELESLTKDSGLYKVINNLCNENTKKIEKIKKIKYYCYNKNNSKIYNENLKLMLNNKKDNINIKKFNLLFLCCFIRSKLKIVKNKLKNSNISDIIKYDEKKINEKYDDINNILYNEKKCKEKQIIKYQKNIDEIKKHKKITEELKNNIDNITTNIKKENKLLKDFNINIETYNKYKNFLKDNNIHEKIYLEIGESQEKIKKNILNNINKITKINNKNEDYSTLVFNHILHYIYNNFFIGNNKITYKDIKNEITKLNIYESYDTLLKHCFNKISENKNIKNNNNFIINMIDNYYNSIINNLLNDEILVKNLFKLLIRCWNFNSTNNYNKNNHILQFILKLQFEYIRYDNYKKFNNIIIKKLSCNKQKQILYSSFNIKECINIDKFLNYIF